MEVASVFTYTTRQVLIQDQTQVGEARRAVAEIAKNLQFDESASGKASIVVTELGHNLVNHSGGGQLLLNPVWHPDGAWLDILALDKGPGMADVGRCMEDGFSTCGTAGNGLGAIRRLSQRFEILSVPGGGTAVLARLYSRGSVRPWPFLDIAAVNLPKKGEEVSGDAWAVRHLEGRTLVMVADGLGHGPSAAEAASKSVYTFSSHTQPDACSILETAHAALRTTRGAAVAVSEINHGRQIINYCGIGNISGTVIDESLKTKSMISQNGIIGHDSRRIRSYEYPWNPDNLVIMHSDGLQSQWSLQKYPGIATKSSALIAAVLYRDFSRGTDDVTVLVSKQ